ncbi:MAG: helicase-related protein [Pyrinomonadaceae bacterium]
MPEIPPPRLINALRAFDLLPAIIFVPSRRRCDEAATEVAFDKTQKIDIDKQGERWEIFNEFVRESPEIKNHKHRKILLQNGVASHHAGHIPAWKFLIEKMMSKGLVNALFATSTVAAGVDFPARTVVISNADTRGDDGWRSLSANELQQMTGRAGRRGKDNVGFVVLAPSNFQNPPRIATLLTSPPDPLESKFRATYSSLLNLLDAFGGFEHIRAIAEKSFAFRTTARRISGLNKERRIIEQNIAERTEKTGGRITMVDVFGFERLLSAQAHLRESLPQTRADIRHSWLKEKVQSGRLVSKGKSGRQFYLVLDVFGDKVSVMRDTGRGATIPLSQIKRVYKKKYGIDEQSIENAFIEIYEGKNPVLKEPKVSLINEDNEKATALIDSLLEKFYSADLKEKQRNEAEQILWESSADAGSINGIERDIEYLRNEIWLPFENRARVLDHFGYLDFALQAITEEGEWLADLRIDKPVHVGEALKRGIFEKLETPQIAGVMASLAADAERDYGKLYMSEKLGGVLKEIEDIVFEVSDIEWDMGVEPAEEINFSAAAAAEAWAEGMPWPELIRKTGAEEGDLVRLLSRTGEALMQVANLKRSKPEAAKRARIATEIILREPIR